MEQLGSQMQGLLERIKMLEEERGREAAQGPHQQYAATLEALRASIVSLERALAAERRSAATRVAALAPFRPSQTCLFVACTSPPPPPSLTCALIQTGPTLRIRLPPITPTQAPADKCSARATVPQLDLAAVWLGLRPPARSCP